MSPRLRGLYFDILHVKGTRKLKNTPGIVVLNFDVL